jgi:hypothetical protein
MKTMFGKIGVVAAVVSTTPLLSAANASMSMSRDLNHLTLLTGPNLTTPPRGILLNSQAANAAPRPPAQTGAASGTLVLSSESPDKIAVPVAAKKLPSPESLRFENQLHSPARPPQLKFFPAPAPQWKFVPAPAPRRD